MTKNEERRLAIVTELARRAREGKVERKYYEKLTMAMGILLQEAGMDAVELTGLYLATLHYAAMIAYGSIATPGDMGVRIAEDVSNAAGAMWDRACRDSEALLARLREADQEPAELVAKVKAAPSDASKRPDIAPQSAATDVPERPESLGDLMSRINSAGTRGN